MKPLIRYLCALLLLPLIQTRAAEAEDPPGYFLPIKQKGQLIWRGRVQDAQGLWYDIRVVPGYAQPVRNGWQGLKDGGGNMREYIEKDKYEDLWDGSSDCLEWAFEDCLVDFAIEGSGKAWKKYFGQAKKRKDKRVFGWWLGYPWAFMQSTVDNAVRIPSGLAGMVLGTAAGVAIVPSYFLIDSSAKAVWNGGVEGVALPVAGIAWNTLIAPPLSLLGEQPTEERVDGFWVRMVDGAAPPPAPNAETLQALAEYGALLQGQLSPLSARRHAVNQDRENQSKALYQELQQLRDRAHEAHRQINLEETAQVERLRNLNPHARLIHEVETAGWSEARIRQHRKNIRNALEKSGISGKDAQEVLGMLLRHAPYPPPHSPAQMGEDKTDPLTESIEVIKALD